MSNITQRDILKTPAVDSTKVPDEGTFETAGLAATVGFRFDWSDSTVLLNIEEQWFTRQALKELRRLLKAMEEKLA